MNADMSQIDESRKDLKKRTSKQYITIEPGIGGTHLTGGELQMAGGAGALIG